MWYPAPAAADHSTGGGATTCSEEGRDTIWSTTRSASRKGLIPTQDDDTLLGGRGGDVLNAVDEVARNDRLLGGAGRDRCRSDAGDISSGC